MNNYVVKGGKKLKGSVTVNASKNSAVAILIASLLNEKKTTIKNLPRIQEVFRILEVLESVGAKTKWKGRALEITPPSEISAEKINKEAAERTRSIILFMGALAGKLREFTLPTYGGCKLGRRTIAPHIYALEELGIKVKTLAGKLKISRREPPAKREIVMYESGDTATENAVLAAAAMPGKTVIKFASANYQVRDLCRFLEGLGVRVEGIGTSTLAVYGRKKMAKEISYRLAEDPIEAMLFIASAAVTKSSITIKRCPLDFLELELLKLKKMGFRFKILKEYKIGSGRCRLADIKTFPSSLKAPAEKICAQPFPGLNIDNLPFFAPIAAVAEGETLVHDWVYENRAVYYTELNRLGANVRLADPHRVFITGPSEMKSAEITSPPALRPSAIILVAMLAAKGTSVLNGTYAIERGYENLVERLRKLGAEIIKR